MVGEVGFAPTRPLRTTAFEAVMSAVPSFAHWRRDRESNSDVRKHYLFSRQGPAPHWGQSLRLLMYGGVAWN